MTSRRIDRHCCACHRYLFSEGDSEASAEFYKVICVDCRRDLLLAGRKLPTRHVWVPAERRLQDSDEMNPPQDRRGKGKPAATDLHGAHGTVLYPTNPPFCEDCDRGKFEAHRLWCPRRNATPPPPPAGPALRTETEAYEQALANEKERKRQRAAGWQVPPKVADPQPIYAWPENEVHKAIKPLLSKRDQGRVMGALRAVLPMFNPRSPEPTLTELRQQVEWVQDLTSKYGYCGPLGPACCPLGDWLEEWAELKAQNDSVVPHRPLDPNPTISEPIGRTTQDVRRETLSGHILPDCPKHWSPLRQLRCWHWEGMLQARHYQRTQSVPLEAYWKAIGDMHLKAVQTLNDPCSDEFGPAPTAEDDFAQLQRMRTSV